MVIRTASAEAFIHTARPASDTDGATAARSLRLRLVIAFSAAGLLASALFPLIGGHGGFAGGRMLGAALGFLSLITLSQAFDALNRLKAQAASDGDLQAAGGRGAHSVRHPHGRWLDRRQVRFAR